MKRSPYDWSFLGRFFWTSSPPDWSAALSLIDCLRQKVKAQQEHREQILAHWDKLLADLGGDPLQYEWKDFRPLRTSREEDWSDWLAHLLGTSDSGLFAHYLFGRMANSSKKPRIDRELHTDQYRSDLIIYWSENERSHIEVKVSNRNLEKTIRESEALETKVEREGKSGVTFDHWILLPRSFRPIWHKISVENSLGGFANKISLVDWHDVARSLRRTLRKPGELVPWRVWAWTFLAAIHKKPLGHPSSFEFRSADPSLVLDALDILEKGLTDEQR
jgi:hypothetical protein